MANRYWRGGGSGVWDSGSASNWSTTSGGAGGASAPTSADDVFFDANSNIGTSPFSLLVSNGAACRSLTISGLDGVLTITSAATLTIYGSVSITSAASMVVSGWLNQITFASTSTGNTIDFGGLVLSNPLVWAGVGGGWTLGSAFTNTFTGALTNGTLDLASYTLTCTTFAITGSAARTLAFSTGKIVVTSNSTTIWSGATTTNLTVTGTPRVESTYSGSSGTRTIVHGTTGGSAANSVSFYISAGAGTVATTATSFIRTLDFTGFTGTLTNTARNIYGSLTISSGMTLTAGTNVTTFGATSGTQTITTNGKTLDFPLTFNGVGGTWQLADALTMGATRAATLTAGTLSLQSYTLTAQRFINTGSGVRTLDWGTGTLALVGNSTTLYSDASGTNLTYAGTPRIDLTYAGGTGSRLMQTTLFVEANAPDVRVLAGTDTVGFTGANFVGDLDYTGFSGTASASAVTLYGNLTGTATMTWASGANAYNFRATSGTQTIDVKGLAINRPVTFNGVGGTFQLLGDLDLAGAAATLNNGTFDANGYDLKVGSFNSNNSNIRAIQYGAGAIEITGAGSSAFDVSTSANLTVGYSAGAETRMTSTSAKTFAGGGASWPELVQGGAGNLTVTGNGTTFDDISNTVQPASVLFEAGSTFNFASFSLSGISGSLITIGSTSAGVAATVSKSSGSVAVDYTSISDSSATGGATWDADVSRGNVDAGGNTGWVFGGSGSVAINENHFLKQMAA